MFTLLLRMKECGCQIFSKSIIVFFEHFAISISLKLFIRIEVHLGQDIGIKSLVFIIFCRFTKLSL